MNLLLLVLIAGFGQIETSPETTNNLFENESQVSNDSNWPPNHPRIRRDENANVDTSVSRMRKIARITNGIYLTQGFIDGSISSDAFISELLHLGSVTPTAIKSMGLEKLQTAFQEISNTKLEKTTDAERIEDRLMVFEDIRKATPDVGNTITLEGADEYKNELNSLTAPGLLSGFEKLSNNIKMFLEKVEALGKTPKDLSDFSVEATVRNIIGQLRTAVEELQTASGTVKDAIKFEHSLKSDLIFAPISKVIKVMSIVEEQRKFLAIDGFDDRGLKVSKVNIEKLAKLGLLFKDHQAEMKSLISIYETRKKRGKAFSALTAGFPGGSDDLHTITKDFGDPWIEQMTDDKDSFEKAMGSLGSLGAIAGSIDGFIGQSPDEQLNALGAVTEIGDNVSPYAGNSEQVWKSVEEAHGCGFNTLGVPDDLDSTKTVVSAIEKLKTRIERLKSFQGLANYLAENDQHLTKILSIFPSQGGPQVDIETIREKLRKSSELKLVSNKLKEAKLSGIDYTASPTMLEQISKIITDFPKIAKFQTESTKHVKAVKCLHGIKNFDHVPKAITAVQNVRKTSSETIQKGTDAIKKMIDATEGLERLETAINKLKGGRIPETDALQLLPDQSKHSMIIGSATRAIIKLKNANKNQKELDEVLKHLSLVKSELGYVRNLDPKLQKNLEILVGLEPKIQKMKSDVASWKAGVIVSSSPKLTGQSSVFTEAQKVTGINEDLRKLGESVEEFKTNFKNDKSKERSLEELRKALLKLDFVGLKLSDHSKYLSDASNSLAVLDVFFVAYDKKLNPPPTRPPMALTDPPRYNFVPELPATNDQYKSKTEEKKTDSTFPLGVFGAGAGSGLLAAIAVILFFSYCWQPNWLKLKRQKKLERENKKLRRPTPPLRLDPVKDALNFQNVATNALEQYQISTAKIIKKSKKSEKTKKSEQKLLKVEKSEEAVEPPSIKKTREPKTKDSDEKARKTKFEKYLDRKVKQQLMRTPIPFLPTAQHPEIEQVQQPFFMLFLYNMMMEIQKAKGFDSAVLLPTVFFDYFVHWFTNGILVQLDEKVNVGDYADFKEDGEQRNYNEMDNDTKKRLKKYSRHDIPINPKTMPRYMNKRVNKQDCGQSVLHANFVRLPNMKRIIITQAPIMKKDDPAPFMNFVREVKASNIIMFGSFAKDGIYMPLKENQKIQYDESEFGEPETVECGAPGSRGSEIKTRLITLTIPPSKIDTQLYQNQLRREEKSASRRKRKAEKELKLFEDLHHYDRNFNELSDRPRPYRERKSRAVEPRDKFLCCHHYQFEAVTDDSIPVDPYPLTRVAAEVYDDDRVIVHCSDGLGVSAAFAGAIYGFQQIGELLIGEEKRIPRNFLTRLMKNIRSHRFGAYKKPIHLALTSMILVEMTFAGKEMMTEENEKIYRELMTCYAKAIEIQNEMNVLETEFRRTPELQKPPAPADAPPKKETKSTGKKKAEQSSKKKEEKLEAEKKDEQKSKQISVKDIQKSSKKKQGDEPYALFVDGTQEDSLNEKPMNKSAMGLSLKRLKTMAGYD